MRNVNLKSALVASCLLCAASAQTDPPDQEPAAIVELGGAAGWNLKNAASSFGPDFAIEFTPIENWLEIEAGTTPLFARHSLDWGTDVLFKKPWTLSKKAEFMLGAGPEWVYTRDHGVTGNALAGEFALDFMFWPGGKHRFGWYLEPEYEYTFAPGHERSIGISGGLLIAIP